jgi:hypothetical protein
VYLNDTINNKTKRTTKQITMDGDQPFESSASVGLGLNASNGDKSGGRGENRGDTETVGYAGYAEHGPAERVTKSEGTKEHNEGSNFGSNSASSGGGDRRWQDAVAESSKAPPTAPWWETILQNRAAVSCLAGLVALVILAAFKPPIVQKTADKAGEDAQLSIRALLVWAFLVAVATYVAPFAWQAIEGALASSTA